MQNIVFKDILINVSILRRKILRNENLFNISCRLKPILQMVY